MCIVPLLLYIIVRVPQAFCVVYNSSYCPCPSVHCINSRIYSTHLSIDGDGSRFPSRMSVFGGVVSRLCVVSYLHGNQGVVGRG